MYYQFNDTLLTLLSLIWSYRDQTSITTLLARAQLEGQNSDINLLMIKDHREFFQSNTLDDPTAPPNQPP